MTGCGSRRQVQTVGRTGVEMEALTAVSVAALTVYDMVKAIDRGDDRRIDSAGREDRRAKWNVPPQRLTCNTADSYCSREIESSENRPARNGWEPSR